MIRPLLALALVGAAAPTQASSLEHSLRTFCDAGAQINGQGVSVKPGSFMAHYIAVRARQTPQSYALAYAMAKASAIASCRSIW